MSKTHKKKNASAKPLQQEHPMASRKTLYSLENTEGEIVMLDPVNFGIRTGNETSLLPLNLPSAFQQSGIKIRFSGEAKETGLTELWAGQPFLLNKIERAN